MAVVGARPGAPTMWRSVVRLVSMPICDASLRNLVRNAGERLYNERGALPQMEIGILEVYWRAFFLAVS